MIFYITLVCIIVLSLITGIITTIIEKKELKAQRTKAFLAIKEAEKAKETSNIKSKQKTPHKSVIKEKAEVIKEEKKEKQQEEKKKSFLAPKNDIECLDLTREIDTKELDIIKKGNDNIEPKIIRIIED